MKKRYLTPLIEDFCFNDHKMCFVSGPRQCGKTTLSKQLLKARYAGQYYNWDDVNFRRVWVKNPSDIIPAPSKKVPLIILDEIHKARLWKRTLKGVYDTLESPVDIFVTGSARLNIYKKGSDSLLGRYYNYRLHPFSLRELTSVVPLDPTTVISSIFNRALSTQKSNRKLFDDLMIYGGFPEPYISQDAKKARLWRRNRVEKLIREDLRDLSRLPELSRIEMLAAILPEKVGGPFNLSSLAVDLEVSVPTVKRWLDYLKELYYVFEIKPYQGSITRSLKKEGKIYMWDYSEVEDHAARFENLIACHLLKVCHYWSDGGEGDFELKYLKNKSGKEIDFIIVKDKKPWLLVEAKLNETRLSPNWPIFLKQLSVKRGIQIVHKSGEWKIGEINDAKVLIGSANEVLSYFI